MSENKTEVNDMNNNGDFDEKFPEVFGECKWKGSGKSLDFLQVQIKDDFNPRKYVEPGYFEELKDNIKEVGLIHPITIVYWKQGTVNGEEKDIYYVVSGHNRYRAVKELLHEEGIEFRSLPCLIKNKKTPVPSLLIEAFSANVSSPLDVIDQGELFVKMYDVYGYSYKEIGEKFGINYGTMYARAVFARYAPKELKDEVRRGKITFSNAKKMIDENAFNMEAEQEIKDGNIKTDNPERSAAQIIDDCKKDRELQLKRKKEDKDRRFGEWQFFYAKCIANIPVEDYTELMSFIDIIVKKWKLDVVLKDGVINVTYDGCGDDEKMEDEPVATHTDDDDEIYVDDDYESVPDDENENEDD